MMPPPPCVAIDLQAPAAAPYSVAVLAARCDAILGSGHCRIETAGTSSGAAKEVPVAPTGGPTAEERSCWKATVRASGSAPSSAIVVLHDPQRAGAEAAEHKVAFRAYDASDDRWASLGLLVAALVTVAENAQREGRSAVEAITAAEPLRPAREPVASVMGTAAEVRERTTLVDVRASGLFALGVLPGLAWGGRIEAAAGNTWLAGLARVTYLPMRARALPESAQQGGEFQLTTFGLGACFPGPARTEGNTRLCAGGDVHATKGRGFGVAEPTTTRAYSGAAWVNASARWPLGRSAALLFAVEGAAAVLRPSFKIEGGSEVYRPSPINANASIGLSATY
ncbi:MAG TPA: hypothetical protein VGF45_10090 [Polyangia bacterium]